MSTFRLIEKRVNLLKDESWLERTKNTCFQKAVAKYNLLFVPIMLFSDQILDIMYANQTTMYVDMCWLFVILPAIIGLINAIYSATRFNAITAEKEFYKKLKRNI
jgi:hypothetical protein